MNSGEKKRPKEAVKDVNMVKDKTTEEPIQKNEVTKHPIHRGLESIPASSQAAFSTVVSTVFWPAWIIIEARPKSVEYYAKKFSKAFLKAVKKVPKEFQAQIDYWKKFICGIPEYDALVRSGQGETVNSILEALAGHNETLINHQEQFAALKEAMKQLHLQQNPKPEVEIKREIPLGTNILLPPPMVRETATDVPIYAAFFSIGAFQNQLDGTAGSYLHELIGKGAESQLMDAVSGIGHRLKAGHDLSTFLELTKTEGVQGSATWFQHMFADLMSPHGIPLPGASYLHDFLKENVGLSEKFLINWTCFSATDVVTGGLSLLILARMHHIATEEQRIFRLGTLTIGQIALLALVEANPFFLATIPLQVLLARHEWRKMQLRRIGEQLEEANIRVEEAKWILESSKAM